MWSSVLVGHAAEFFEGGQAATKLSDAVFAERLEYPISGSDAQLLNGRPIGDGVTDLIVD